MKNVNVTPELLAFIRQRYSKQPAPLCCECGEPLSLIGIHDGLLNFGCTGTEIVNGKVRYKPGRIAGRDSHYHLSRVRVVDLHDDSVLALVDLVEASMTPIDNEETNRRSVENLKRLVAVKPAHEAAGSD